MGGYEYGVRFVRQGLCFVAMGSSLFLGCAKDAPKKEKNLGQSCAPEELQVIAKDSGQGLVFTPDPISSSGNPNLLPTSSSLDQYRQLVPLGHLSGYGVLHGKYVQSLNILSCGGWFSAFSKNNDFSYSSSNIRFQETMAYYYGDTYRTFLDNAGYLQYSKPAYLFPHCSLEDNSFFQRSWDEKGVLEEYICLGDSLTTPGASYADDGTVIVHELQHGTTASNYSPTQELGTLFFDEAGVLNEAISDFFSLIFTNHLVPSNSPLDLAEFSRWALGSFSSKQNNMRGGHSCPQYDSDAGKCGNFPQFINSKEKVSISYTYPDGVGWPYTGRSASDIFASVGNPEDVHMDGVFLSTFWDIYNALLQAHANANLELDRLMTQLFMETLRHLPPPDSVQNRSPVTGIGFANALMKVAEGMSQWNASDLQTIQNVFTNHGFLNAPQLEEHWAEISRVYIQDSPSVLKDWLENMGSNSKIVSQTSVGGKNRLDPGEVAAIWFDITNRSTLTAGGVMLTLTSLDPEIEVLGETVNRGFLNDSNPPTAQVMYAKVNGNAIVSLLNLTATGQPIPTGNSYFKTNPSFNTSWGTALWIRVRPDAQPGKLVRLQVKVKPANGPLATLVFSIRLNGGES